jgi:hypothetical protein
MRERRVKSPAFIATIGGAGILLGVVFRLFDAVLAGATSNCEEPRP